MLTEFCGTVTVELSPMIYYGGWAKNVFSLSVEGNKTGPYFSVFGMIKESPKYEQLIIRVCRQFLNDPALPEDHSWLLNWQIERAEGR